jgi:hypothetical protein
MFFYDSNVLILKINIYINKYDFTYISTNFLGF